MYGVNAYSYVPFMSRFFIIVSAGNVVNSPFRCLFEVFEAVVDVTGNHFYCFVRQQPVPKPLSELRCADIGVKFWGQVGRLAIRCE